MSRPHLIALLISYLLTHTSVVLAGEPAAALNSKSNKVITAIAIPNTQTQQAAAATGSDPSYRGWDYLVRMLKADGIPQKEIDRVYKSKRMPRFGLITFKLKPKESRDIYQGFFNKKTMMIARKFLGRYRSAFTYAEDRFKVDRHIIAAIIYVETKCGQFTGREMVLNRLSRVAAIAEPENLKKNYKALSKEDPSVTFDAVQKRGAYLKETFYPEVPALFEIARRNKIDIFGIRGSRAGAFGLPQFLPTTYIKFGVDANGDGRVSLYNQADAIASTANFLSSYGWKDSSSPEAKAKVLWNYNHSDAYVSTVLKVGRLLASK